MLDVQRVREQALKLAAEPDDGKRWLADRLLLGLDIGDMDKALGLKADRTGPSPLFLARNADRHALIRELAERFYTGPLTARADTLGSDLKRYCTTGWERDRERGEPHPPSPRRLLMFRICMADPDRPPPTSISRLHEIVTAQNPPTNGEQLPKRARRDT
jgi:hypothetical protein